MNELNDAFSRGYGDAKLANRVKGRRRGCQTRAHSSCRPDSRLPARLQGTFKDLSREIRFSPDLQPRCIPVLHGFLPLCPPPPFLARPPSLSHTSSSHSMTENSPSFSPEYFSSNVRSHCRARTPWGPRIGPLSRELSVNVPFAFPFSAMQPLRNRGRN